MLWLYIGVVVLSICFIWKEKKWLVMYSKIHSPTGNLPLVGNLGLIIGDDEVRMKYLQQYGYSAIKNGGLTSMWLCYKCFIVVADAKICEQILKTSLEKDDILKVTSELTGNGSIFAPVQIWRPRRKVIAPTFSMKNLNQFVNIFSLQSFTMVEQLQGTLRKGTFSIWKYLSSYAMDSVCETALGVNVNAQQQLDNPFLDTFEQVCQMMVSRMVQAPIMRKANFFLPSCKRYMKNINSMWDFVDKIVKNKRKELKDREENKLQGNKNDTSEQTSKKTFLELFIKSSGGSSGFTDLELREETLVLVLAGTDTSAVAAGFTCLMLARHPLIQDKVYEEIKTVIGDSKEPITATDLPKFKYLEAVIKESLRLYPPVPVIARTCDKDLQLPSGLSIAKGTSIMINIWAVHRNPEYWGEDVEEFKPDRFIESLSLHPAAFIPFSYGPRSCLGYQYAMMSMKTAMVNLIRHYRISPASPDHVAKAPLRLKYDIMMKHVDNFKLQLEART